MRMRVRRDIEYSWNFALVKMRVEYELEFRLHIEYIEG